MGAGGFASALASAWNASVATLLGRAGRKLLLGRRHGHPPAAHFEDAHVLEAWNGAVSDDFAMTQRARRCPHADRFLRGMPGADAASLDGQKPAGIHEPANSDHARLFASKRWAMGAAGARELLRSR